jgi:cobalt transporter subunit CbtA
LFTTLANVIGGIGFALLLVAVFAFRGTPMDYRRGIEWGLAGFAVFSLAPALGLPPELPGMDTADLLTRQTWWLGTVVATGGGLGLVILQRRLWARLAGIVLITTPHIIGAPHPATLASAVPAELAAQFAIASLVTAALFWIVLGGLCGHFYARYVDHAPLAAADH